MIIVCWPDCYTCGVLKGIHPHVEYITLVQKTGDDRTRRIKRVLGKHGIDNLYFPVIVDDEITKLIPMKEFDAAFAQEHPKLY